MNGVCVTCILCLKRCDCLSVSPTWLSHLKPITGWLHLYIDGKLVGGESKVSKRHVASKNSTENKMQISALRLKVWNQRIQGNIFWDQASPWLREFPLGLVSIISDSIPEMTGYLQPEKPVLGSRLQTANLTLLPSCKCNWEQRINDPGVVVCFYTLPLSKAIWNDIIADTDVRRLLKCK